MVHYVVMWYVMSYEVVLLYATLRYGCRCCVGMRCTQVCGNVLCVVVVWWHDMECSGVLYHVRALLVYAELMWVVYWYNMVVCVVVYHHGVACDTPCCFSLAWIV